ncbi:hypothetical protein ACFW96_29215 [Streptomyces gardneri]|uniref:hypothetical protein n=1 Tax=Streptomyces gardneri TaxID=66892 RepID=UPI0036BDE262
MPSRAPSPRPPSPVGLRRSARSRRHEGGDLLLRDRSAVDQAVEDQAVHAGQQGDGAFVRVRQALGGELGEGGDPGDELGGGSRRPGASAPALLDATRPGAVLHHDIHELVAPLPSFVAGRVARQAGRMGRQLTHPLAVSVRSTVLRPAPSRVTLGAILRYADWTAPSLAPNAR